MWQALRSEWGKWREGRRQYALDRALYKGYRRRAEDDFFEHVAQQPLLPHSELEHRVDGFAPDPPTTPARKAGAPPSVGP